MAILVLTNAKLLVGAYDFSGDSNELALNVTADEKDVTTFGTSGYRTRVGGLKNAEINAKGFVDYGTGEVDPSLGTSNLAVEDVVATIAPDGLDDGDTAFTLKSIQGTYQTGTEIGEVMPFDVNLWGRGEAIRGTVIHPDTATVTASGNGSGQVIGTASASQYLYASLHVLSVSGTATPTLTVVVQSDDNAGFTSPTSRITFSPATAVGAQWGTRVAGPITPDNRYRVNYTVSGTNPSFRFVVVVGIA